LAKQDVVRAVRNLPAGSILEAEELTSASELVNPIQPGNSEPLAFYVGKSLTRSVTVGSRVAAELVQEAPIIQRGDKVQVSVINGSARLELEVLADTAGYVGDSIFFSNPSGSRRFRALITASGRAELLLNGSAGDSKRRTANPTSSKKGSS
jgi:flagella basal body P-ring formation protein FlgA